MTLENIRETEKQIRSNQNSLLSSYLSQNGFMYSNVFDNCNQKTLGEVMFECLKDMIVISKQCWTMDKDDFKQWVDEAFKEIEAE